MVGALVALLVGVATAVLNVGFKILDYAFEVQFCFVVVVLDVDGLVFSVPFLSKQFDA